MVSVVCVAHAVGMQKQLSMQLLSPNASLHGNIYKITATCWLAPRQQVPCSYVCSSVAATAYSIYLSGTQVVALLACCLPAGGAQLRG
jgi:hypothetical protein